MGGVKYIAPVLDGSGYSEAARNYVLAIHKQGYPITVAPITFEKTRPDLGENGKIIHSLINKQIDYDKVIVHCTPDLWSTFTQKEVGKKVIGYTVWETSRLHPSWVPACNGVDEVWVPCTWNMEVFKDSGVTVPLFRIPHAIDIPDLYGIPDFGLADIPESTFIFYSIFQWQERKNPYALLAAYTVAFAGVKDVALVLKTYRRDHAADAEEIVAAIKEWKKHVTLAPELFPKIYLVVDNLSQQQMLGLHKLGNAFVLLQRSEGWGLPHFEAAAAGNPVITPNYGGQTDFLNMENSFPVRHTLTPVIGMAQFSPYYESTQYWCEVDVHHAIESMQYVYNNRGEAEAKGRRAREFVSKYYNWDTVGKLIVDRLQMKVRGSF